MNFIQIALLLEDGTKAAIDALKGEKVTTLVIMDVIKTGVSSAMNIDSEVLKELEKMGLDKKFQVPWRRVIVRPVLVVKYWI
jgi:hypothetical protein